MTDRELAGIELDETERAELMSLSSRRNTAQALVLRAGIILACVEGGQGKVIAARLGLDRGDGGQVAAVVPRSVCGGRRPR